MRANLFLLFILLCTVTYAQRRSVVVLPPTDADECLQPLPPVFLNRTSEVSLTAMNTSNIRRHTDHHIGKTRGIDVSHYQGNINWRNVGFDDHVSYVYVKATESSSLVDNMYQQNLRGARVAGIPVGTYHFFSPTSSATTQLLNLTRTMPDLRNQDLVPMVDVETRGKVSINDFRIRLRQFLRGVEDKYGVRPIIYTGANFYNKYLSGYFDDYLFMIAKYDNEIPVLSGNPKFAIWQYSSTGQVAGIKGYVDMSVFVDNYDLNDILIKGRK